MDLDILYSDNHVLVVNKPNGIATQPNDKAHTSLQDLAKLWVKEKFNKPGNVFLHPIHRLDTPTSGIVLFARTDKALSRLNEAMRCKKMKKTYLAVIEGHLLEKEGRLEHWHTHGSFKAHIALKEEPHSKKAALHYKVNEEKDGLSVLEITLETGRYHQIRAQFSFIGHPVLGDQKYGSSTSLPNGQIALHHHAFSFPHPITYEEINLKSAPPSFF